MSSTDTALKTTVGNAPIPQYWNPAGNGGLGAWEAVEGSGGALKVQVTTLPPLPAGTNNIGDVDVLTLPPLVAGTAIIGKVGVDPAANTVTANIGTTGALALDGTDQTGVTPPTGATGIRGWLSAQYALFLSAIGLTNATAPTKALLIGGKDVSGNMHALQLDANKNQKVSPTNSAGTPIENTEGTLLASAARTATTVSPDQTNYNARGVVVTIRVTVAGTGTLTPQVDEKDAASSVYSGFFGALSIAASGTYRYVIYPGATGGGNSVVGRQITRTWRVNITHSDGSSWTYSVGYALTV